MPASTLILLKEEPIINSELKAVDNSVTVTEVDSLNEDKDVEISE
jgi:hypothetical protein